MDNLNKSVISSVEYVSVRRCPKSALGKFKNLISSGIHITNAVAKIKDLTCGLYAKIEIDRRIIRFGMPPKLGSRNWIRYISKIPLNDASKNPELITNVAVVFFDEPKVSSTFGCSLRALIFLPIGLFCIMK